MSYLINPSAIITPSQISDDSRISSNIQNLLKFPQLSPKFFTATFFQTRSNPNLCVVFGAVLVILANLKQPAYISPTVRILLEAPWKVVLQTFMYLECTAIGLIYMLLGFYVYVQF